jgi:VWFA-related protein
MMARETGGRSYFISEIDQLRGIYAEIADELTSQYTIGYVSTNAARNGAWRAVQVRVDVGGAAARTRTGYFGPKAGQ